MQVCKSCGREIRYVAGGYDKTYVCEPDAKSVVSESGWLHKAYALHECKNQEDKNGDYDYEKKEQGNNSSSL